MTTICFTVSFSYDVSGNLGHLPRIVIATPPAKILECVELVEKCKLQGCPDFSCGLRASDSRAHWAFAILYKWLQTQRDVCAGSADLTGRPIDKVMALNIDYDVSIGSVPEHSRDLVPSGLFEEWEENYNQGSLYGLWR